MSGTIKLLAKDTAVYGISTILGRFLNWALFPLYVKTLPPGEYGIVTDLYAFTALALVLLTYGMETGFFRFVSKEPDPARVYANSLRALGFTSGLFILLGLLFLEPFAALLRYPTMPHLVGMLIVIVGIDAFTAVPFAYLRYQRKAKTFAAIKIGYILLSILLNLFFLVGCPLLVKWGAGGWIEWFYRPDWGVGYIFLSNLIANLVLLPVLLPFTRTARGRTDLRLIGHMLAYSLPLMFMGIVGTFNQMADKLLFRRLFEDEGYALSELGIYAAGYKIAVVVMMSIQAFRYAYEPIVFKKDGSRSADGRTLYATAMHYFLLFEVVVYVGVLAYLDILKLLIAPAYYPGLKVVPIIMAGEILYGVYFNLSVWYKLTGKTLWGFWISLMGCTVTVAVIVLFAPRYSFLASAWAVLLSNLTMVVVCYLAGRRYYPVPYRLRRGLLYLILAGGVTALLIWGQIHIKAVPLRLGLGTLLLLITVGVLIKSDKPLQTGLKALAQKVLKKVH